MRCRQLDFWLLFPLLMRSGISWEPEQTHKYSCPTDRAMLESSTLGLHLLLLSAVTKMIPLAVGELCTSKGMRFAWNI